MKTLREVLEKADSDRVAIGHFNISDLVGLKAVFDAARELNVPVIVGVSEGEREFIGVRQVAALVRSLREEYGFPIFLNADHTHSLAKAMDAAKAGFDWIVFDLSTLPFEENARQTKSAVEALKGLRPDILWWRPVWPCSAAARAAGRRRHATESRFLQEFAERDGLIV